MNASTVSLPLLLLSCLLVSACREKEIHTYRLAKSASSETTAQAGAPAPMTLPPGMQIPTGGATHALVWTAPQSWKVKPASAVRRGSFAIEGAGGASGDVSITAFPGDVGGALENVNRWRGQIGLQPIAAETLPSLLKTFSSEALAFTLVEMRGSSSAILAAYVSHAGETWYFKLTAPAELIEQERGNFENLLRSVRSK